MATRPVQDMSDTAAALRAAREVQADVLSPDLYRRANELFFEARREYKFKHFSRAEALAIRARRFAEQAEFDAIRGGASRSETDIAKDPFGDAPPAPPMDEAAPVPEKPEEPYAYPTPEPIPAEEYEKRMNQKAQPTPNTAPR